MTEDVMVEWHHQFNGHECEQAPGDGEGQGSLVWVAESDTTERLNNSSLEDPEDPEATPEPVPQSPQGATTEALVPRDCSATREATTVRSLCSETKSSPHSVQLEKACAVQLEKACAQQQRPSAGNNKQIDV